MPSKNIDINLLYKKAVESHNQGNLKKAEKFYLQILDYYPKNFELNQLMAILLSQKKDFKRALKYFNIAIEINPNSEILYLNQGIAFQEIKDYEKSLNSFEKSFKIKPNVQALNNQGIIYGEINNHEKASKLFEAAKKIDPNFLPLYFNHAKTLHKLYKINEAIDNYQHSIKLNFNLLDSNYNLGCIYQDELDFDKALKYFQTATNLDPKHKQSFNNIGQIYHQLRMIDEALANYNKALEIDKNYSLAKWNKSLTLLLNGEFIEGWKLFEYRWSKPKFEENRYQNIPILKKDLNYKSKKILVWHEQGYGDVIQFSRYILELKKTDAQITFEVQKPLNHLFNTLNDEISIVDSVDLNKEHFDYQIPLMSLPYFFKTDINNIPNRVPYLFSNQKKVKKWKESLKPEKVKIGLVWSGSLINQNLKFRSINLKKLNESLIDNFEYHSLQKEYRDEDKKIIKKETKIFDHSTELYNFEDTAALVDCMDLIITIDSAIAHLAGALAKETWIMLPFNDDYRWLLDRDDSPWYPTVKLYRQSKMGEWDSVIKSVNKDLIKKFS